MNITLQRLLMNEKGTLGIMMINDKPLFPTLELPWKNNQRDISCIPAGVYKAVYIFSEKFQKNLFVLQGVPGRDLIEIHIGNSVINTHGCILIGMEFSLSEFAIVNSQLAFDNFMYMTLQKGFIINIKNADGVVTEIHHETTQI